MADLPSISPKQVFEEFKGKFEGQLDLSQIQNSNNWYLNSLERSLQNAIDENIKQIISKPISKEDKEKLELSIQSIVEQRYLEHKYVESVRNVHKRALNARRIIKEFVNQY